MSDQDKKQVTETTNHQSPYVPGLSREDWRYREMTDRDFRKLNRLAKTTRFDPKVHPHAE